MMAEAGKGAGAPADKMARATVRSQLAHAGLQVLQEQEGGQSVPPAGMTPAEARDGADVDEGAPAS